MAKVTWKTSVDGDWSTGSRWSTGTVPGAGDRVELPGDDYTVLVTAAIAAYALTIDFLSDPDHSPHLKIDAPGKSAAIGADLVNNGVVSVDVDNAGGSTLTVGGTLRNSAIINIGNTGIIAASSVVAGSLAKGGAFYIQGGTAQASLTVGSAAQMTLSGTFHLSGNARLAFAGGGITTIGGTSSYGNNLYLDGAARITVGGATTTNSALAHLASNVGVLSLDHGETVVSDASFANTGEVDIANGSTLTVRALHGDGIVRLFGTSGSTSLIVTDGNAPDTLSNTFLVSGTARATFAGGAITTIGQHATLLIDGGSAVVSVASDTTSNSALTQLATIRGSLLLDHGAAVATTSTVINTGNIRLDHHSKLSALGLNSGGRIDIRTSVLTVAGSMTISGESEIGAGGGATVSGILRNSSVLNLANGGGTLRVAGAFENSGTLNLDTHGSSPGSSTVSVKSFANTGTVYLTGTNGATTLIDHEAAPAFLTGSYDLTGRALLEYASGGIGTIVKGATLSLTGPDAHVAVGSDTTTNSALARLHANKGVLRLVDTDVHVRHGLINSGALDVYATRNSSSMTIDGTLRNGGTFDIGIYERKAPSTAVTVNALANAGMVHMIGSEAKGSLLTTLTLADASSDAGSIVVDGPSTLTLGDMLTVTGSLTVDGGTISGGTLAGDGLIEVRAGNGGTLDGVTVAADATVTVAAGGLLRLASVTVEGRITGAGDGTLALDTSGSDSLAGIAGFATIRLGNSGASTLVITDAAFAGVAGPITVAGGKGGSTVDGSALGAAHALVVQAGGGTNVLTGGAGDDTFRAGRHTMMTGGGGADLFVLASTGPTGDRITDFSTGADRLAFSDGAYDLGIDEGHGNANPQALDPSLFSINMDGTFATTGNRFAYNASTGALYYDQDGSGTASTAHTIATLTAHPALTASNLFFVG